MRRLASLLLCLTLALPVGAGRRFDGANDNVSSPQNGVLNIDTAQHNLSCWINVPNDPTGFEVFFTVGSQFGSGGGGRDRTTLLVGAPGAAGFTLRLLSNWTTTNGVWDSDNDFSTGTWHHLLWTYDNALTSNDPVLYVNGSSESITEATTPAGSARTGSDSARWGENIAGSQDFDGDLAECAEWNGALLTAADATMLAAKFAPPFVQADNLEMYQPFWGSHTNEFDLVNGYVGTVTSATKVDHPPMIYPISPSVVGATSAAPPARRLMIITRRCPLSLPAAPGLPAVAGKPQDSRLRPYGRAFCTDRRTADFIGR